MLSIAHLGDAERMFFVTLLLNEIIAWMRTQSGTSSLRAILYMDEVFGFLPPVAAPPSKVLLLTLLKQARAFGLGVVLSTQNPVDLDYKALSNAGTWFIGRLQTEQDRNRVRDGLLSAAPGGGLNSSGLDATLSGLGKRTFLLHNVHEKSPVLFQTRWAMSYLRGPLTREDIRRLSGPATTAPAAATPAPAPAPKIVTGRCISSRGQPTRAAARHSRTLWLSRRHTPALANGWSTCRACSAPHAWPMSAANTVSTCNATWCLSLEPGDGGIDWRDAEALTLDPATLVAGTGRRRGLRPAAVGPGGPGCHQEGPVGVPHLAAHGKPARSPPQHDASKNWYRQRMKPRVSFVPGCNSTHGRSGTAPRQSSAKSTRQSWQRLRNAPGAPSRP